MLAAVSRFIHGDGVGVVGKLSQVNGNSSGTAANYDCKLPLSIAQRVINCQLYSCGSIACIYTAQYDGDIVALKIVPEDVKRIVHNEVSAAHSAASFLQLLNASIPRAVNSLCQGVHSELCMTHERHMAETVARAIRTETGLRDIVGVPTCIPRLCSDLCYAYKFVEGDVLDAPQARKDASGIAKALGRVFFTLLHRYGILFLDLNSRNVVVAPNGKIWLIDLGGVQVLSEQTTRLVQRIHHTGANRDMLSQLMPGVKPEALDAVLVCMNPFWNDASPLPSVRELTDTIGNLSVLTSTIDPELTPLLRGLTTLTITLRTLGQNSSQTESLLNELIKTK